MKDGGRRPRRKARPFLGRPNELGGLLDDLRTAKGLSLRQVEEATDKAVSNAYLSQLEKGKIRKPSPNVLHSLAAVYAVPYEALMEKAGYLLPSEGSAPGRPRRLAAFAIDDLTAEEEEELLRYLAFIRSRTIVNEPGSRQGGSKRDLNPRPARTSTGRPVPAPGTKPSIEDR